VKCRGRRRRRRWEEGEGRERRFHPKTREWERQKHVVRKGFPVPPLLLPPVLQGEKEITKRDDVDGVSRENDENSLELFFTNQTVVYGDVKFGTGFSCRSRIFLPPPRTRRPVPFLLSNSNFAKS
jgi:hypothetical protein